MKLLETFSIKDFNQHQGCQLVLARVLERHISCGSLWSPSTCLHSDCCIQYKYKCTDKYKYTTHTNACATYNVPCAMFNVLSKLMCQPVVRFKLTLGTQYLVSIVCITRCVHVQLDL